MAFIEFSPDAADTFAQQPDAEHPMVMLNLLRYKASANYPEHAKQARCSGREAYQRYAALVVPLVDGIGAQVKLMGRFQATLIGAPDERWDDLLMVEYPSRKVFLDLMKSEAYQAVVFHRQAALEDSRLIAFGPGSASFQD